MKKLFRKNDVTGQDDGNVTAGEKRSKAKLIAVAVIAAICAAVILPLIMGILISPDVDAGENIVLIEQETAQIRDVQTTSKVVGTVKSNDSVNVVCKTMGQVKSLSVSEGDQVKEGDLICIIDSDDLRPTSLSVDSSRASLNSAGVQVQNAQLAIQGAETNLANAKRELERNQVLYDSGAIALAELEQYQDAVTAAEINLASARNSLSQARYSEDQARVQYDIQSENYNVLYNSLYVRASTSGRIESLDVHVNDLVNMQTPICTISKRSDMKLVCEVTESVAGSVVVGDTVKITQKGNEYRGIVESAGCDADAATGTFEVKIGLENADAMASNSKATVYLNTERSSGCLTVPYSAVYYDSGEPYVFVNENGIAMLRYITTGINDGSYIVVTGGLSNGARVITTWSSSLSDGTKVMTKEDAAAAAPVTDQED